MNDLVKALIDTKVITILRGYYDETLQHILDALYAGGVRFAELPFSSTGAYSDEFVANQIRISAERLRGKMYIGAGTVLKEEQILLTKEAGGTYIVSPDVNPEIIKKTKELGLMSIPGAFTATEASLACRAGADFVKLFPAGEMKPSYLKALVTPLSHIRFLAVGGITPENIPEFLEAGAYGFGVASNILSKEMIQKQDYKGIEELTRNFVSTINKVQGRN